MLLKIPTLSNCCSTSSSCCIILTQNLDPLFSLKDSLAYLKLSKNDLKSSEVLDSYSLFFSFISMYLFIQWFMIFLYFNLLNQLIAFVQKFILTSLFRISFRLLFYTSNQMWKSSCLFIYSLILGKLLDTPGVS